VVHKQPVILTGLIGFNQERSETAKLPRTFRATLVSLGKSKIYDPVAALGMTEGCGNSTQQMGSPAGEFGTRA